MTRLFTDEHRAKLSAAARGSKKNRPSGRFHLSTEHKKSISQSVSGRKHWNWQGGKTAEVQLARKTAEYKAWRRAVFERDGYRCSECGATGCYLEADHIKSFAHYPKLRYNVMNGRTLCVPCHSKTPNYKTRAKRFFNNQYTKPLLENKLVYV